MIFLYLNQLKIFLSNNYLTIDFFSNYKKKFYQFSLFLLIIFAFISINLLYKNADII